MILLLSASSAARACAAEIEKHLAQPVQVATSVARGLNMLRSGEFSALVVDQYLLEPDFSAADSLAQRGGTAILVFVNLAISGAERVVRDVRAALKRRDSEQRVALKVAATNLRSEFNEAITGILLWSQLALEEPSLPASTEAKLRSVRELAESMRSRLEAAV